MGNRLKQAAVILRHGLQIMKWALWAGQYNMFSVLFKRYAHIRFQTRLKHQNNSPVDGFFVASTSAYS